MLINVSNISAASWSSVRRVFLDGARGDMWRTKISRASTVMEYDLCNFHHKLMWILSTKCVGSS